MTSCKQHDFYQCIYFKKYVNIFWAQKISFIIFQLYINDWIQHNEICVSSCCVLKCFHFVKGRFKTKIMGNKYSSMSYKLVKNFIVYIYHKYWVKYNNYILYIIRLYI